MIKDFEFYHGAVFTKLIQYCDKPLNISSFPTSTNASYIINDSVGIYIKHSSKRMSPWSFTLKKAHQEEIYQMKNLLKEVFLVMVCGEDGIIALNFQELKKILDEEHGQVEWIRASRNKRKEYSVNGSDGGLNYKISKNEFPGKLFTNA
jgi:hypothetical protein